MSRHRRAMLEVDQELMVEIYAVCRSVNRSLDELLRTSVDRLTALTGTDDAQAAPEHPPVRRATLADLHARCRELNVSFSDLLTGQFRHVTDV